MGPLCGVLATWGPRGPGCWAPPEPPLPFSHGPLSPLRCLLVARPAPPSTVLPLPTLRVRDKAMGAQGGSRPGRPWEVNTEIGVVG